ncbi:MAG: rRNA maturation RNase YbeY [Chloroflexi bacterium RBG_16_57_11]|nr:MAG: rRNA maturation RNase YbeY [Chloroflexi bacterium RBG_16_57_11]
MIFVQVDESLEAAEGLAEKYQAVLERAAQQTLQQTGADADAETTLVLSDDARLQALNRQFLGIDAPTDVLSFVGGDTDPDSDQLYLGDVIVSLPRAQAQAAAGGYPIQDELQLLVVHGVLHLLGYDHADEGEKAKMWAIQAEILNSLGCQARA